MQKNLGYVIPSIVIPDMANGIGYWYLGSVPLGVRATGTIWTIGSDHYWYCDNTKTDYLAEIPVEDYNREFQEMLDGYADDWTEWFTTKQSEWNTFYNTSGAQFTAWFNRMKGQLSTDAAGNLQLEIDNLVQSFSEHIEDYDISSANYSVGDILMYKNRLCSVVAAITAGDTFVATEGDPNQNIEYTTIFEIAQGTSGVFYNTDADAEADIANIPEGSMVYTNDGEDEPINARQIAFDDGTQQGSDVETQIKKKAMVNTYYNTNTNKMYFVNADGTVGGEITMETQRNYTFGSGGPITIDISSHSDNETVSFSIIVPASGSVSGGSVVSIATIKTWSTETTITTAGSASLKGLYADGKVTLTPSPAYPIIATMTFND